jgi:hypothetical protein
MVKEFKCLNKFVFGCVSHSLEAVQNRVSGVDLNGSVEVFSCAIIFFLFIKDIPEPPPSIVMPYVQM